MEAIVSAAVSCTITSRSSICSKHFHPNDFKYGKRKTLRTSAVPSLVPCQQEIINPSQNAFTYIPNPVAIDTSSININQVSSNTKESKDEITNDFVPDFPQPIPVHTDIKSPQNKLDKLTKELKRLRNNAWKAKRNLKLKQDELDNLKAKLQTFSSNNHLKSLISIQNKSTDISAPDQAKANFIFWTKLTILIKKVHDGVRPQLGRVCCGRQLHRRGTNLAEKIC